MTPLSLSFDWFVTVKEVALGDLAFCGSTDSAYVFDWPRTFSACLADGGDLGRRECQLSVPLAVYLYRHLFWFSASLVHFKCSTIGRVSIFLVFFYLELYVDGCKPFLSGQAI